MSTINIEENDELSYLMTNLKVLSKIKSGQKCKISNNMLVIDNNNVSDSLKRFINGDSRYKTLEKIQDLIKLAIKLKNIFIECNIYDSKEEILNQLSESELNYRLMLKHWMKKGQELNLNDNSFILKLDDLLKESIYGLKELKQTYIEDVTYCSKLDIEIELIERTIC